MSFDSERNCPRPDSPKSSGPQKKRRKVLQRAAARAKPRLECLEERTLLSGVSFSAPVQYTVGQVGQGAESIAVADLNGDGKPDLVLATTGAFTVDVLLGNGNGTFQAAQNFGAGGVPESVVAGDLNGDGKTDLVVTDPQNNSLGVLLGNGDGTFQTVQLIAVGSTPDHLALGDFNGDGKTDVAVTDYVNFQNDVSVLLGNGDGTFQAPQNFPEGHNGNDIDALAVGDFNGDGKTDVVVALTSTVTELLGNGDGTLQAAQDIEPSVGDSALGLAVGDVNGDGKADVIVANPEGRSATVLLGNGDGTFQTAQDYGVGASPVAVVIGDFNGDGKPDLATVSGGGLSVVLGNGDGTFQAAEVFDGGALPNSIATADFNHDCRLDIAVTDTGNTVSVLLNAKQLSATAVNVSAIAGAPFNGPVATFASAYPAGSATTYTATIDWGDGTVSPGVVSGSGTLTVSGSHTYTDPGVHTMTVVIAGSSLFPATGTVSPTATVAALGQGVQTGLTGDISFWHSKSGQTLIKSFNGGSNAIALSSWLAGAFPNLYGVNAGPDDLAGQTNAQVAAFYKTLFALTDSRVQVQVLATALNVYATTQSLGGASGLAYGFVVTAPGLGADSFSVGADGAAFGVAKKTTLNVYELLEAVNRQAYGGVLFGSDVTLETQANNLFHRINVAGAIS